MHIFPFNYRFRFKQLGSGLSSTRRISAIFTVLFAFTCSATSHADTPTTLAVVDAELSGHPPSGPHTVVIEHDPSLATHTIYRPNKNSTTPYPVVLWGEGACEDAGLMFPEFLSEIASHGYVVLADGPPRRSRIRQPGQPDAANPAASSADSGAATPPRPRPPFNLSPDGTDLILALDWAEAETVRAGSRLHNALDLMTVLRKPGLPVKPVVFAATSAGVFNRGRFSAKINERLSSG